MELDIATVDTLLTTTRSVRKRLDLTRPVPTELIRKCVALATQAPTAGNAQNWGWVVITDADRRARIADIYRNGMAAAYKESLPTLEGGQRRIMQSAIHLMDRLHDVPVHVVPCILDRTVRGVSSPPSALYGSIYPAVWSFQLALRSRGLGTTMLHVSREADLAAELRLPKGAHVAALMPVAFYTGDSFRPASRHPVDEVLHWEVWT